MSMCKLHSEFYRQQAKLDALLTRRCHTITEGKNGEGATYIKTAQGLTAHCPWRAQHCEGPALCDLPACDRFERALESDCRTGRIFDRAAWLGARQRCFQRGIYQGCYCG